MGKNVSKPINEILSEKIKKLFECNNLITNFELYNLLNVDENHSMEFKDLIAFFCYDFNVLNNLDSLKIYIKNVIGENFLDFIESSNFFRVKKPQTPTNTNAKKIPIRSIEKDAGMEKERNKERLNQEEIDVNAMFDILKIKLVIFLFTCDNILESTEYNDKVKIFILFFRLCFFFLYGRRIMVQIFCRLTIMIRLYQIYYLICLIFLV